MPGVVICKERRLSTTGGMLGLLLLALFAGGSALRGLRLRPRQRDVSSLHASIFSMDTLAAVNAELLAVREEKTLGEMGSLTKCSVSTLSNKSSAVSRLLELEGALSVGKVLSPETCEELKEFINAENLRCEERCDAGFPAELLFGGVNCRGDRKRKYGIRRDLFMPASSTVVVRAMGEVLNNLRPMLEVAVGPDAMIHEISSVVSDPTSSRQCIHADTIVLPCPQYPDASMLPLYTIFVALQDVEEGMGHTVYLPRTHTESAHLLWNACERSENNKMAFLAKQKAVQSALKIGDCAIFDSRVLHAGRENSSDKRRILFYVTISRQPNWPLPDGLHGSNSIRQEDRWKWKLSAF